MPFLDLQERSELLNVLHEVPGRIFLYASGSKPKIS